MVDSGAEQSSTFQTVVSLIQALVWPSVIVGLIFMFKDPVTKLVDRTNITKATMPGGVELTFAAAVIVHAGKQEIAAQGALLNSFRS